MKLIIGLGNPGKDYQNTRHNVGFLVLDAYLNTSDWKEKFNALYHEERINGEKVIFVKPLTFMNLSGDAVVKYVNYYDVNIEDILVVHDDLDLPFSTYKLKKNSSAGGHNGIKSIISCVGTQEFKRIRVGISGHNNIEAKDYVLGRFGKEEQVILEAIKSEVVNAVSEFIDGKPFVIIMGNYNKSII